MNINLRKIILIIPLILCLISLLYPPYIVGDITIKDSEIDTYFPPEYERRFILDHNQIYQSPLRQYFRERINFEQIICELTAAGILYLILFGLLKRNSVMKQKETN